MKTDISPSRRQALRSAAAAIAAPALVAFGGGSSINAFAQSSPAAVDQAVSAFAALQPGTAAALVRADLPQTPWSSGSGQDLKLFVASAVKTFILAQFLRDAEVARNGVTLATSCSVDDGVRSPSSPVFGGLTGTSSFRIALEAMITHSDNTATDIALAQVGSDRVRALIAQAGLRQTQIPDSTRRLFSYLAGAPVGVDLGWLQMQRVLNGDSLGLTARSDVINNNETMVSSASDMVNWYRQALSGQYFQNASSLLEFKRISAMPDALWRLVPADTISYGKGGSIDWAGFHALAVAGQMRVKGVPVSFCFSLNWQGGSADSNGRAPQFIAAASKVLAAAAAAI